MTSMGRRPLPSSTPFEQTTMGRRGSAAASSARPTPRSRLDGVTMTAAFARRSASSCDSVATMRSESTSSLR